MLAPYLLGARINRWAWTRRLPARTQVARGVWLGRLPERVPAGFALIDMSAEFHGSRGERHRAFPCLDLVTPPPEVLAGAAEAIEAERRSGRPVLIACALGFSRSAAASAAWLVRSGRAGDAAAAIAVLERTAPRIHLDGGDEAAIAAAADGRSADRSASSGSERRGTAPPIAAQPESER